MKIYAIPRVFCGIAIGVIAATAIRVSQYVYGGDGGKIRMSYWGIAFIGLMGGLIAAQLAEERSPHSPKEELLEICERFIKLPRFPRCNHPTKSHRIPIQANFGLLMIACIFIFAPIYYAWRVLQAVQTAHWSETVGTILDFSVREFKEEDSSGGTRVWYIPKIQYEYRVDDEVFVSDRITWSPLKVNAKQAQKLKSRYHVGDSTTA